MFDPVPMTKLRLVVLKRDERAALREMGRMNAVHWVPTRAGPDTAPLDPPDRGAELARCGRFLDRLRGLRKTLEIAAGPPPPRKEEDGTWEQAEAELAEWERRTEDLLKRLRELRERRKRLEKDCEEAALYEGLDLSPEPEERFSFLHFVIGAVPDRNAEGLRERIGGRAVLWILPERRGLRPLAALARLQSRPELERALAQAGFRPAALPVRPGETIAAWSQERVREREEIEREVGRTGGLILGLAAEAAGPLGRLERFAETERRLLAAEQFFPSTDFAALMTGWAPTADAPAVERGLRDATGSRCAVEAAVPDGGADDEVPVLLRPHRLLRPFIPLVEAYGLPRYRELDPTFFVAASYLLMFGMMFGDLGQGAALALAGWSARRWGRARKVRETGTLVLCAGLSSAVFGVLYGSLFGLPQFKRYALWMDPFEGDLAALMLAGVGVGAAVIVLGLVLNIVNRFRRGDRLGALLEPFGLSGLLFYGSALFLASRGGAGLSAGPILLLTGLPVAGWLLKEPIRRLITGRSGEDGFAAAVVRSAVEAFESAVLYLANTISFVRLSAYAASHAALLAATFLVAEEVRRASGSPAAGILVVVLGNAAVVLLEGTVAAIQALRLEYYEFFGKFFSGEGRPFRPFSLAGEEHRSRKGGLS